MNAPPTRRTVLAALAGATLAGCTENVASGEVDLPDDCPKTQGLDVEWPRRLDAEAAGSFVEAYDYVYVRDVVYVYEPQTMVDAYEVDVRLEGAPDRVGDGYVVAVSGEGAVYTPSFLQVLGVAADAPPGVDVVPADDDELPWLAYLLESAATLGEGHHRIDRRFDDVDERLEQLASRSDDFEPPSGPGESGVIFFDVDGTTVEVTVTAGDSHADVAWTARYYVDEHVVRRIRGEEGDPREGELLECRVG